MHKIDLAGDWKLSSSILDNEVKGKVPGSVFNDLINSEIMPDPYYRLNEQKFTEISFSDFTYTKAFTVNSDLLNHQCQELVLDGVDTLANIYLNDELIQETDNMHRTYAINVKGVLKSGKNTIAIELKSPSSAVENAEQNNHLPQFTISMPGIGHIRKAHYMFGWDWGPILPDLGIHRSVYFRFYDEAVLDSNLICQVFSENSFGEITAVDIFIDTNCKTYEDGISKNLAELNLKYELYDEDNQIIAEANSPYGEQVKLNINNPNLWWPVGFGYPYLYTLKTKLYYKGELIDSKEEKLGIRKIELRQDPDQWGEKFEFRVNNLPIFIKGANYIPEDNILSRTSKERTKKLLDDCIASNFNTIRVWGGGIYPEDYFFELCDEMGILVWQDFMFACATYEIYDEKFADSVRAEIADACRRIRNHASLLLLCGNNEMESGHIDWEMPDRDKNKQKYLKLFEDLIPEVLENEAPYNIYWPSSPSSGGGFDDPNGESKGDMHYWGVWHSTLPFKEYKNINPRFMSEFGLQSFPALETLEKYIENEDKNIFSKVMENHQKAGPDSNQRILNYVSQLYRYPEDFRSVIYISQLVQAEGIKYGVEHWRQISGRCMGILYWQLNDCWPVASWSSIDYLGKWKALQYYSRDFYNPQLVSAYVDDAKVNVYVSNDAAESKNLFLSWELLSFSGDQVVSADVEIEAKCFNTELVQKLDFSKYLTDDLAKESHLLRLKICEGKNLINSNTYYFAPVKYMNLEKGEVNIDVQENTDEIIMSLSSSTFMKSVELRAEDIDLFIPQNYFDLLPGEEKHITFGKAELEDFKENNGYPLSKDLLKEKIKYMSVVDTYK